MLADLEPLATSTGGYVFAVVLGLLWGSFANVCIYRMPIESEEYPDGMSVVRPGSHCFACKAPIRWYDNVPLLAYVWLRGRCRNCGAQFSPRYLLVEAITGALFGVAWWFTVGTGGMFLEPLDARLVRFAIDAVFVVVMIVIAFIDLDHKLILHKVTVPALVVFYAASLLLPERRWYDGLVGAALGYGGPWLINAIYRAVRKRDGIGGGDYMLLAVVGALLGWRGVLVTLFGGSLVGVIISLPALVLVRRAPDDDDTAAPPDTAVPPDTAAPDEAEPSLMTSEVPFGSFLAIAAIFEVFAEPWIDVHFRLAFG